MLKTRDERNAVPAAGCLDLKCKRTCSYSRLPDSEVDMAGFLLLTTGSEFLAFGQVILK